MKKLYYFLLLLPLWGSGGLSAQVSVELLGKTPPQVSFTVSWGAKAPYNNKIWVLAQVSTSGIGSEERALVTEVSATGATASTVTGHRGFWLETSGSNGSATVTATLDIAPGVEHFNWCVYAFDYPPNAVLQSDGTYQLRGSPPFTINGNITEPTNTFGPGTCMESITDLTDNPAGIVPAPPTIAWSSDGEASQSILIGNAVIPITFVTASATGVTPADLPDGVSGTWASPDYIVSGTPLGTGTYNYTLTATDAGGCSATVSGTITVVPPGANQPQGSCTFTQPDVVNTFTAFPATYSASTFVTLVDERDGNNYTVVKMPDGKWWMAQNLNYQKDLTWQANSDQPSTVAGFDPALIGHFWCPGAFHATNSSRAACDVWGALYSWETTMMRDGKYAGASGSVTTWPGDTEYCNNSECTNNMNQGGRGICPPNWHVPTDAEWGNLVNAMGTNAGAHGKSTCTCKSGNANCVDDIQNNWFYASSGTGLDTYGFRVIPTGTRNHDGAYFFNLGDRVFFRSSSAADVDRAWLRRFIYNETTVNRSSYPRSYGFPVRCVKD